MAPRLLTAFTELPAQPPWTYGLCHVSPLPAQSPWMYGRHRVSPLPSLAEGCPGQAVRQHPGQLGLGVAVLKPAPRCDTLSYWLCYQRPNLECQLVSWLLCFLSSSLLLHPGRQQQMTTSLGACHPCGRPGWCRWHLASALGYRSHLGSEPAGGIPVPTPSLGPSNKEILTAHTESCMASLVVGNLLLYTWSCSLKKSAGGARFLSHLSCQLELRPGSHPELSL